MLVNVESAKFVYISRLFYVVIIALRVAMVGQLTVLDEKKCTQS